MSRRPRDWDKIKLGIAEDKKHKPSSQLARHIKQKEDEAYKRGKEDGKKEIKKKLGKMAFLLEDDVT